MRLPKLFTIVATNRQRGAMAGPFNLSTAVNAASTILVGRLGDLFWLRVEGRGTFQNSLQVRQAIQSMIATGVRQFVIDLERCPIMDSTFLGTLTGAASNLRDVGDGQVHIFNANPRNLQLIRSLGLDYLLEVDASGTKWAEQRKQVATLLDQCAEGAAVSHGVQAGHVLEAHQALAEVSDENRCRFQDVIEFLEKELGSQGDGGNSA